MIDGSVNFGLCPTGCVFTSDPSKADGRYVMIDVQKRTLAEFFTQHEDNGITELKHFENQHPPYPSGHLKNKIFIVRWAIIFG